MEEEAFRLWLRRGFVRIDWSTLQKSHPNSTIESLARLLGWLNEQHAWSVICKPAARLVDSPRRPFTPVGSGPWSKPDRSRLCIGVGSAGTAEVGILARPMGVGRMELAWAVLAGEREVADTR